MSFIQKYGYILLIMFLSTAFTIAGVMKEAKSASNSLVEVTVAEGDTLWGLAQDFSGKEQPKKWIAEVMELNDLQSTTIRTGETLKLPENEMIVQDPMMTELAGEE